MIGLNLGSGQRPFTSTAEMVWINVDSQEKWNPDIQCDASKIPYDDESVDFVVLSHVYEHFGCGEANGLLQESYRLLKPSGSLIVAVPNMKALAERWIDGRISEYIFMVNAYGAYMGDEADRHKWGSTPDSLKKEIEQVGHWNSVRDFDYREIPGMDLARDWWITCLEAQR